MALIDFGWARCPLCNDVLEEGDDLIATTHFITEPEDPFYRFSDVGINRSCFLRWERREEFIARYNAVMGTGPDVMQPDGTISKARLTKR
jgi:hypothetical protein